MYIIQLKFKWISSSVSKTGTAKSEVNGIGEYRVGDNVLFGEEP